MDGCSTNKTQRGALRRGTARRGFTNPQLIIGLALLALVAFLMQLQSGAIGMPAFMAGKSKSSKKKTGAEPQLFAPPTDSSAEAEAWFSERSERERVIETSMRESWQALGRMEGEQASAILEKMEQDKALLLLSGLRERELSRILEAAPPDKAAQWVNGLAALPQREALPPEFAPYAARNAKRSELDGFADKLNHFREFLGMEPLEQPQEPAPAGASDITEEAAGTAEPAAEDSSPADAAATQETETPADTSGSTLT